MKRLLANLGMSSIYLILGTLIETLLIYIYIPLIMSLSFGTNTYFLILLVPRLRLMSFQVYLYDYS
jgi:hypothetical protein